MDAETIRQFKRVKPFKPFELHLANGDRHQIYHWEDFIVTNEAVVIASPDSDSFAFVTADQVKSIEEIKIDDCPDGQWM